MTLILIAAHDPNLVIGKDGGMPWHYSEDLKFFKKTTMGCPLIMGRVVFEELNEKPLPGRENIILSRSKSYNHVKTVQSLQEALDSVAQHSRVFIIGGGNVYEQTIGIADELIITEIKKEYDGDTFFPEYRDKINQVWQETWREDHPGFSFVKYKRKN